MYFLTDNIFLLYTLPLIVFLIAIFATFFKFTVADKSVQNFSIFSNIICLLSSLYLVFHYAYQYPSDIYTNSVNWFATGDIQLSAGILIDKISSIFAVVLSVVYLVIQFILIKNVDTQKQNSNITFAFVNLLLFSNLIFVFSSNLIQSIIFSSIAGICIYLLLNMNFSELNTANNANKFLIIDKAGNLSLLLAVIIMIYYIKAYELSVTTEIFGYEKFASVISDFYVYMSDSIFYYLCMLIFIGIAVKSAIVPFHFKNTQTVYNNYPLNYLIYGISVTSGLLLVIRLMPLFELSKDALNTIIFYCIIAALYALIFVKRRKKSYLYSCCSAILISTYIYSYCHQVMLPLFEITVFIVIVLFVHDIFILENKTENGTNGVNNLSDTDILEKICDWFINNIFTVPINIVRIFNKYVFPFFINIFGYFTRAVSWTVTFLQNGKIQSYILYSVFFSILILLFYLFLLIGAAEV